MLLLAAESRAEGRVVVSAEGRKTASPLQSPPLLDPTVFNRIQPAIRCINILFFYICVYMYINDTPVKGLEKTTGMKVFQMLCLLDRKKGVEGFIRVAQAI